MNISSSILSSDLHRMARDGAAPLPGRPITEPSALADANFFIRHQITREQYGEMERKRDRSAWEERVVADLQDEPPSGLGANIMHLSPQKARYTRFRAWLQTEKSKLADAHRKLATLDGLVEAPRETEGKIQALVRKTAAFLLGRGTDDSAVDERATLDSKLTAERHRAEAAQAARPEIERLVEIAELRVRRLKEREPDFVRAAVIEHAIKSELGARYQKAVDELAAVLDEINGLCAEFGGYGNGLPVTTDLKLPAFSALGAEGRKIFARDGNVSMWRKLADELRAV